jgi:GNAT superfamily N-acetyltransferase
VRSLAAQARARRWFICAVDIHRAAAWAAHATREGAVGLVATTAADELVGHAALVPLDEARGEVCFGVAAPWRRHGIAGRLLAELDRRAKRRGLTTIVAEGLAENSSMLAVLREQGRVTSIATTRSWRSRCGSDSIARRARRLERVLRGSTAPRCEPPREARRPQGRRTTFSLVMGMTFSPER